MTLAVGEVRSPADLAARANEIRRRDIRMIVEAGHSLGTFHSGRWINEIDDEGVTFRSHIDGSLLQPLSVSTGLEFQGEVAAVPGGGQDGQAAGEVHLTSADAQVDVAGVRNDGGVLLQRI